MLEFLLALLTTATVAVLLVPLMRKRVEAHDRLESELAIHRDQLAEIERERASGTLNEAEAGAARLEIERRMLASADHDTQVPEGKAGAGAGLHRFLPPALCLAIPLLALGIYLQLGRPGLPAAPFVAGAQRPAPDDPAAVAKMIAEVKQRAKDAPDDPDAQSALGEALTLEAQGTVSEPALQAFTKALAKNANDARAAYYLGLHEAQAGDSAAALKRWRELEARSPTEAPWLPMLRAEIRRVSQNVQGGEKGMPLPNEDQVGAMAKLSPEDREKAIRGMVEGLAERMKQDPGDRSGWLRLANARRVLAEFDKAAEAYARADKLQPIDGAKPLADWAEAEVRQLQPGQPPSAEAVAVLERLEKVDPDNAMALFYLGAASFAKGDKADAARRWKQLLARLPPNAPIREMLEKKISETAQ